MKKFLLAIAIMLATASAAYAQNNIDNAKKAAEKAKMATLDPKGAVKASSWINLGKKMFDAYNAPVKEFSNVQFKVQLNEIGAKPKRTEIVQIDGKPVEKLDFDNASLYFNTPGGQLIFTEITKYAYQDALEQSFEAYKKGFSLDPKKGKEIASAFKDISEKFLAEATMNYYLGRLDKASYNFEQAALVSAEPPYAQVDTASLFNASVAARMAGNDDKSKELLEKCLEFGYDNEGKVYPALYYVTINKLADAGSAADTLAIQNKAKAYLQAGIDKYPLNQEIVVNLINLKIQMNENPEEIFDLFTKAKQQDPKNASLYAVEADVRAKLGMKEQALEGYKKSVEVDPKYEYGYYCIGKWYYDAAMEYYNAAQREDDNAKYAALVDSYVQNLENSVAPLETFFEISTSEDNKVVAAQYLKSICYNLYSAYYRQDKADPGYKAKQEKYAAFLKGE
ncbi:MAG: hypothetical protein J5764_01930 [Bacteroidales bacterium]|nr:hypothetical protein [Bacteroidales bacterium]